MKIHSLFAALFLNFFANSVVAQNLSANKYNWYDHIIPIVNPEFYHYDFDRFGVKWPTNLEFSRFGNGYRYTGGGISLGGYYHRLGILTYIDLSAIRRGNNAEIGLLEENIVGNIDSLKLSKGNYYQQNNSISLNYPFLFKNFLKFTPSLGWQKWKMVSEVELSESASNQVLQYYYEEKYLTNATIELKVMLFALWGGKKEISFANKQYFTRKGFTFEPAYKVFLGRNLSLLSIEVGTGEFLNKPFNSTIIPFLFFGIGHYQGEINSTVYRIGAYVRYDLFHLKADD